jgi:GNAT superfamily N-acetyltransferase
MNQDPSIRIRQATVTDLELVAPLFDAYRVFYGQVSDLTVAQDFLLDRFRHNQSVILLAARGDAAVGFTQLYPSFSSVSAARIFILNDLFVAPDARRSGVAAMLLAAAAEYGRAVGAVRLTLTTAHTNESAQALYGSAGWVLDTVFQAHNLVL